MNYKKAFIAKDNNIIEIFKTKQVKNTKRNSIFGKIGYEIIKTTKSFNIS